MKNYTTDARLRNCLKRDRISQLLVPEADVNVIKVIANSGYGKTRAVMDYLVDEGKEVAWVTLTSSDNYSSRFWDKLSNAIRPMHAGLADVMKKLGFPADTQVLHRFIQKYALRMYNEKPFILILDDFHNIYSKKITEFLDYFIRMEINHICIYMLSRTEIDFISEEIKTQSVVEEQLAFTLEELEAYYEQKDIKLSHELLRDIHQKTSGWPCAVYLSSLTAERNINLLNHSVQFSDLLIFDTIEEEIFSTYSDKLQRFLLCLSHLDFHPVQLIEDLYKDEIEEFYESLGENIFIKHNHHTMTFECHPMFKDFLENRQWMVSKEEVMDTCQMAAEWFEKHGMIIDALECYSRTDSYQSSWDIIWEMLPTYLTCEFANILLNIINNYSDEFRRKTPMTYVVAAALHIPLGEMEAGMRLSWELINTLEAEPETIENRNVLADGYLNLAFFYMQEGNTEFKDLFRKAAEYQKGTSLLYGKPFMFLLNGEAITLRKGNKGELRRWVKAVEESEKYYTRLLAGHLDGFKDLAGGLGYYYQGNMQKAEEHAIKAVYSGVRNSQMDIACQGYYLLVRLSVFGGDYEKASEAINQIKSLMEKSDTIPQFNLPDVAIANIYAKLGLNQYIPDWIMRENTNSMAGYSYVLGSEPLVRASGLLNAGEYFEVIPYMQQMEQLYKKTNRYIYLLHTHLIKAIAYYNIRNMEYAVTELYTAYQMAHKNDIITVFAIYGKYTRSMILGLKKMKHNKDYEIAGEAKQKLFDIPDEWIELVASKSTTYAKRASALREQYMYEHPDIQDKEIILTRREKEILIRVCEGFTRDEIADNLNLSVNTIKSTLNSIFAKLGAANSAHAARIATLKGLI